MWSECYYQDSRVCGGQTWVCQTCGNTYCETHWHRTDLGENVECVVCENERLEPRP